jgi:putative OPT family oligopeptide transporter
VPMVPPQVTVPEITTRSIIFGIVMNIFFAMAATLLALKIGQGIETAIPISILAVGLSGFLLKQGYRRSSLLENINVLAIGTTSGIVAGGTCFTMPAIYILDLYKPEHLGISTPALFFQIFLVPFLGAVLGVVFLVPFRRYFVRQMHGKLPFPEGTATNEILVSGAEGGERQAWILLYSLILAMIFNFLTTALKLFSEKFTTGMTKLTIAGRETVETLAFRTGIFQTLTEKIKAVFSMGTGAYYLGLGFIIGLRYASIICAGSFLSYFVIVPLLGNFELDQLQRLNPELASTSAEDIWHEIPRIIGIGGIFTAGIISILKMGKVIVTALTQALGGLIRSKGQAGPTIRTEEDISYPGLLFLGALVTVAMAVYFRLVVFAGMENPLSLTIVAVVVALGVAFLFTTVSAWAIAMISVTPISGMTVTTIIITAVLLLAAGLPKGDGGMLATLLVGGVVCAALSMAGTLVTEFKLGYWLGASPRKIQWSAVIAAVLASACVTATIMILDRAYGYKGEGALSAPQANMMASALQSFIGTGEVPWLLYGIGVAVALLVELIGISALAFALGMYLPMEINTPILVGAFVALLVKKSSKHEPTAKARSDKGILIASGLVAGAAFVDVLVGIVKLIDEMAFGTPVQVGETTATVGKIMPALDVSRHLTDAGVNPETLARFSNVFGLVMFLLLCAFVYWDCRRARLEEALPAEH